MNVLLVGTILSACAPSSVGPFDTLCSAPLVISCDRSAESTPIVIDADAAAEKVISFAEALDTHDSGWGFVTIQHVDQFDHVFDSLSQDYPEAEVFLESTTSGPPSPTFYVARLTRSETYPTADPAPSEASGGRPRGTGVRYSVATRLSSRACSDSRKEWIPMAGGQG